jgi:hypothetical protein
VHTRDLMVDSGSVKVDAPWAADGPDADPVLTLGQADDLTITVTGTIEVGGCAATPSPTRPGPDRGGRSAGNARSL